MSSHVDFTIPEEGLGMEVMKSSVLQILNLFWRFLLDPYKNIEI